MPSRGSRWLRARGRSLQITRAGWLFIVLTLAVGLAAINSGSNLLHAIFGAQMAMIVGSGLLSEAIVARAEAARTPVGPLHARTAAAIAVTLDNLDRHVELLSVSVEDAEASQGAFGGCSGVFAVRVPAAGRVVLRASYRPERRGWQRLPPAVVATRFPFGLFVKRRDQSAGARVLVYPRVGPATVDRTGGSSATDGPARARLGRSGEFHGLREYRAGDEVQRIDWRAWARLDRPIVREHEVGAEAQRVLELTRGRTGDPAFEAQIEALASEAVALLEAGRPVGLRYDGRIVVPAGLGTREPILRFLAEVGSDDAPA